MTHPLIFISYSHEDEREKDKLLAHLGVLQRQGLIGLWSIDRIGVGANWEQEINEAMAQARAAILLISVDFLTSDFILGKEVPTLLKRRKSEGLTIFPVIAKACAWQAVDWLTEMNVRPKNGRPIWGAGSRRVNEDLAAIAKEVEAVVKANSHTVLISKDIYSKSKKDRPLIRNPRQLEIPSEVEFVLAEMFPEYKEVVIRDNFSSIGHSGSWVYGVQLFKESDISELPVVAKIASVSLIEREWQAFQKYVKNKWLGVAELWEDPVFPAESNLAGLCYPLMGGGIFQLKSLQAYYLEATSSEIVKLLSDRLFEVMRVRLLLPSRPSFEFSLRASYDRVLPPNLLIEPMLPPANANPSLITPEKISTHSLQPGNFVHVEGFSVTKVDLRYLTMDLQLPASSLSNSYCIRIQSTGGDIAYRYGQVVPRVTGKIIETRESRLNKELEKILGQAFNSLSETINLPDGTKLYNPLHAIADILNRTRDVKINYIHGDLNWENILVDPKGNDIKLIDFADAREDYVLHDLLRLETEIITKFLPQALADANLPAEVIYPFYNQLHFATFELNQERGNQSLHVALEKPFAILIVLRTVARDGFYDQKDFNEYYHGLIVYLLSALKYRNLDERNGAKQVAFWGAATIYTLLKTPPIYSGLASPHSPLSFQAKLFPSSYGHFSSLSLTSEIYHNLPQPDYGHFVGRDGEFAKVTQILRPYPHSQHALVTIDGIGGIGKSALALEIAHHYLRRHNQIHAEEHFKAIVWTSAKQNVLTPEGIIPRSQVLRTLESICITIAVTLQREDITRAQSNELIELVRQALTQQRTLLIVDNLETIDDEAVISFLRELPAPTKAIITTRHRIDVAYPVRLLGMSWEDVQELIIQESEKRSITLSEDEIRRLYERTAGVPLAIVWSIAQIGFGYDAEVVLTRLGQPNNDITRFCFEATLQKIHSKPSFRLLMALSLFVTDANREALGYIANLSELDRDDGLVELEKLSLVNKSNKKFDLLPLTKSFLITKFQEIPKLERTIKARFINYFLDKSKKLSGDGWRSYHVLDEDIENFQLVLEWTYQLEMLEFGELVDNLGNFLHKRGLWKELVEYAEMAVDLGKKVGSKQVVMRQKLFGLGWIRAIRLGELEKGLASIEEGKVIALELGDEQAYATALRDQGAIYRELGEYAKAKELLHDSFNICRRLKNSTTEPSNFALQLEIKLLGSLGEIEFKEGNLEAALTLYEDARQKAGETDEREQMALNLRRLSEVFLSMGKFEEAYTKAEEALEMFDRMNVESGVARCHFVLAKINRELGKIDEAKLQAEKVCEISSKLGLVPRLEQARKFLETLN